MPTLTIFGRFSVTARCGAAMLWFPTALVTPTSMADGSPIVDSQPRFDTPNLQNCRSHFQISWQLTTNGVSRELPRPHIRRVTITAGESPSPLIMRGTRPARPQSSTTPVKGRPGTAAHRSVRGHHTRVPRGPRGAPNRSDPDHPLSRGRARNRMVTDQPGQTHRNDPYGPIRRGLIHAV